jgi:hypothetical protein
MDRGFRERAEAVAPTVAEVVRLRIEAIATDDPDLIWLDVPDDVYYGDRKNIEPQR